MWHRRYATGRLAYAPRMDADAIELRVLGCLLEKQRTTPDQYPLTLNALRLACNQTTNRDPIVDYDEREIHDALQHLARRGWTRVASGPGSRAAKYRQLFDQELGLERDATAVLCVLMLRGAQTPGELKQRTERLHRFDDIGDVLETLDALIARDLVARLERRPGQKEERYRQLLGSADVAPSESQTHAELPAAATAADESLERRVDALDLRLERLREAVRALEVRFG